MKPKWTLKQHQNAGDKLKLARRLLIDVYIARNAYRKDDKRTIKIDRLIKNLEQIKCELDGDFCKELPNDFDPHVFYGTEPKKTCENEHALSTAKQFVCEWMKIPSCDVDGDPVAACNRELFTIAVAHLIVSENHGDETELNRMAWLESKEILAKKSV